MIHQLPARLAAARTRRLSPWLMLEPLHRPWTPDDFELDIPRMPVPAWGSIAPPTGFSNSNSPRQAL
jgi:hypothetical protein